MFLYFRRVRDRKDYEHISKSKILINSTDSSNIVDNKEVDNSKELPDEDRLEVFFSTEPVTSEEPELKDEVSLNIKMKASDQEQEERKHLNLNHYSEPLVKYKSFRPSFLLNRDYSQKEEGTTFSDSADSLNDKDENIIDLSKTDLSLAKEPKWHKDKKNKVERSDDTFDTKISKDDMSAINGDLEALSDNDSDISPHIPLRDSQLEIYNKEIELLELSKYFDEGPSKQNPWHTDQVTSFLKFSVEEFQSFLAELKNKESCDKEIIRDLNTMHHNIVRNVREIESGYAWTKFHCDSLEYMKKSIPNSTHPMLEVASKALQNIQEEYAKAVDVLGSRKIGLQQAQMVWKEFHNIRTHYPRIEEALCEVELHEERLAELDDWREKMEPVLENDILEDLCNQVAVQKDKIIRYTTPKIEDLTEDKSFNWKDISSDLKKLQFLRVQALLSWIGTSESPDWLCDGLKEYLVDACKEYCETEKLSALGISVQLENNEYDNVDTVYRAFSWVLKKVNMEVKDMEVAVDRDTKKDLHLEMLYNEMRGALSTVKYSRIENRRHEMELNIHKSWLESSRSNLKNKTREELAILLENADEKVKNLEEKITEYVESLSGGDSNTEKAELQTARLVERKVMRDVVKGFSKSWNLPERILNFGDESR